MSAINTSLRHFVLSHLFLLKIHRLLSSIHLLLDFVVVVSPLRLRFAACLGVSPQFTSSSSKVSDALESPPPGFCAVRSGKGLRACSLEDSEALEQTRRSGHSGSARDLRPEPPKSRLGSIGRRRWCSPLFGPCPTSPSPNPCG